MTNVYFYTYIQLLSFEPFRSWLDHRPSALTKLYLHILIMLTTNVDLDFTKLIVKYGTDAKLLAVFEK